ncbi:hypothetical protein GCM10009743_65740 [Kribbella swartbergensis]
MHASAPSATTETDWAQIAALYLGRKTVRQRDRCGLSRVVAVAKAYGAARGLSLLDDLEPVLAGDTLVDKRQAAVPGPLARGGRQAQLFVPYCLRAAELTANLPERRYLVARGTLHVQLSLAASPNRAVRRGT